MYASGKNWKSGCVTKEIQDDHYCLVPSVDIAKLCSRADTLLLYSLCTNHLDIITCVKSCCLPPRSL